MKAPAFAYAKPRALAEVFDLLERHGEGARILAGGQSLIPSLNMRLSSPQKHAPLLAEAVVHIAHPAIRNRGTLGGSLALADPAAEYPACLLALNAVILVEGRKGQRQVKAKEFFKGLFETDLRPGEVLVAAQIPVQLKDERSAFLELARRQGDYAIVGLAAFKGAETRLAFLNVGPTPVLARNASRETSLEKARKALLEDLDPSADLYNSAETKRHLAGVLLERAWTRLSI